MTSVKTILNLSPQIWDNILQYLTPSDYLALINSSPEWRRMFKEKTTSRLYPLLVPVFLKHDIILDHCFLKWRMINRETKSIVDRMLEEPVASPTKYWENQITLGYEWSPQVEDRKEVLRQTIWKINTRCYSLDNQEQVDKLVNYFDSFDGNPFLTGYLQVSISEHGPWNSADFIRFLTQHGHQILHLSWHFVDAKPFNYHNSDHHLKPFFVLLPHLPNLKILKLSSIICLSVYLSEQFLMAEYYPKLENLEFLDVQNFNRPPSRDFYEGFTHAFLRHYGPQLKTVVCNDMFFKSPAIVEQIQLGQLRNLRRLSVLIDRKHCLKELCELELPFLEELQICEEETDEHWQKADLQDILNVINSFAQTLANLRIFVTWSSTGGLCKNGRLIPGREGDPSKNLKEGSMAPLPKVKNFSTSLFNLRSKCFWKFLLLKCTHIQELSLYGKATTYDELDMLSNSFQLTIIPKLRRIRVTCGMKEEEEGGCTPEKTEITAGGGIKRLKLRRHLENPPDEEHRMWEDDNEVVEYSD